MAATTGHVSADALRPPMRSCAMAQEGNHVLVRQPAAMNICRHRTHLL